MDPDKKGSILWAIFWMFLISLLLFWMPFIGPLVAGVVGGKRAGGVGEALIAVFLPALVLGVLMFLLATVLSGFPLIGIIAGLGALIFAVSNVGPLLLGAVIGGFLA